MNTKFVLASREIWLVIVGVVNYFLNRYNLPSFDPTPEFYTSLLVVLGAIRIWFTSAKLKFSR